MSLPRRCIPAVLIVILILLTTLGPVPHAAAAAGFPDVSNAYWAAADIDQLAQRGILDGLPSGSFDPTGTVTRAQFAKILVLVKGLPTPAGVAQTFGDVPPGSWAFPYVEAAYRAGLIQGRGHGAFSPAAPISRQDMAVMIGRSLGLAPLVATGAVHDSFTDRSTIAGYAQGFVAADAELGLMRGMPGGAFDPWSATTRAQAAVVGAGVLQLPAGAVDDLMAQAVRSVQLVPQADSVAPGGSIRVATHVYGPGGTALPLRPTFAATGGTIDGQGEFTAGSAGTATITAQVGGVSGSVQVTVANQPAAVALAVAQSTVAAGTDIPVQLTVLDGHGQPLAGDAGRTLVVQVSGPGNPPALSATDSGGQAQTDWKPTAAGTYTLQAASPSLQPSAQVTVTVTAAKASQLSLTASPATVTSTRQTAAIQASLEDAYGNPVGGEAPVELNVSPPAAGTLDSSQPSIQNGGSTVAHFTASGDGTAALITATAPGLGLTGTTTVHITIEPSLAFTTGGAQSATAGTNLSVPVRVLAPDGAPLTSDSGRSLTLEVTAADGTKTTVAATDAAGTATFALAETVAGSYSVQATGDGLTASPSETVTFKPGPATSLKLWSLPASPLAVGQTATLYASEADAYGNLTPGSFPVAVAVTGADSGIEHAATEASSGQAVGTFVSYGPGTADITLVSPGSSLPPFQYLLRVGAASPAAGAAVVSGKGLWLRYSDVTSLGAQAIVQQAKANGISHLYVWVGSTYNNDGFMGGSLLADILPLAHQAGISVLAWIYDTLYNPSADLQLARQAYTYTAPSGDRADGLALDLETDSTMTPAIVGPFDQQLRAIVGPSYPLIAVTYPPQYRPSYPFATMAQTFDAFAPMDYWHVQAQAYTAAQVEDFVTTSIDELRQDAGSSTFPVSVIAQGYDVFSSSGQGAQSPTAAEVQGAVEGADAGGAVGVSLYEWTTATPAEWQAFLATPGPGSR